MSSTLRLPIGSLSAVLDEIGAVDPIYLTTGEKQTALVDLARERSRL
jgi:hypothetical protein